MDSFDICKKCGDHSESVKRCGGCKEVYYCSKEHQKEDWKSHKACCQYASENPLSVWIKVAAGEGSGIANPMEVHLFNAKEEGRRFAANFFSDNISRPLPSPFCRLLDWDVEIFCSSNDNDCMYPIGRGMLDVVGKIRNLNSAGIYLGADLPSGLTRYSNLSGPIFVTGRHRHHGKPITAPALWGIINFIWDSMDDYGEDTPALPNVLRRADRYKNRTWTSYGGDCNQNIYSNGPPDQARLFNTAAIDHRHN